MEFRLCVLVQGTAVDDSEQQMTRKPDDKEPLAGLAFKIMADQFQVCTLCTLTSLFIRHKMCAARLVALWSRSPG